MDNEINLADHFRVILKRKWLILVLALVFSFFAWQIAAKKPVYYQSSVSILTLDSNAGELVENYLGNRYLQRKTVANLGAILRSRTLAEQVVKKHGLQKIIINSMKKKNKNFMTNKDTSTFAATRIVLSSVSYDLGTPLKINVLWGDPKVAAKIANAYAIELISYLNSKALNINLRILDKALPPTYPQFHDKKKLASIGFMFGLVFGVFCSYLLEYFEKNKIQLK